MELTWWQWTSVILFVAVLLVAGLVGWIGELKEYLSRRKGDGSTSSYGDEDHSSADVVDTTAAHEEERIAARSAATRPGEALQQVDGTLLDEFDRLQELQGLGGFLQRHPESELASFIDAFPFNELRLDYGALQEDFRNSTRCEMVLHLANILLRYDEYLADPKWKGLLPASLNANALFGKLIRRLAGFIEKQAGIDIAASLRGALYDFAMDLIRTDRNREAMICLAVSRPSPREDHDFWLCACYHNVGKMEKDLQAVCDGIKLAEGLLAEGSKAPGAVLQKLRQTDMLGKLRSTEAEIGKERHKVPLDAAATQPLPDLSTGECSPLEAVDERYRDLASAVKSWWREEAKAWWSTSGRAAACCDDEGEQIPQGDGSKTGRRLLCETCANERLTKRADWDQAVRDLTQWFGTGVPAHLRRQAERLWDAPKASTAAKFTMRIGSVFDSGGGVMVAGTPEGAAPSVGDRVQVVGADGTKGATIKDTTSMGHRVAYVLAGIAEGSVKQGDILQG